MARRGGGTKARPAFATLIRQARLHANMTQEELADYSGMSRSTLIRWENGEIAEPEARQVVAAADALGIARIEAFRALGWLTDTDEQDGEDHQTLLDRDIASILDSDIEHSMKLRIIDRLRGIDYDDGGDNDGHHSDKNAGIA